MVHFYSRGSFLLGLSFGIIFATFFNLSRDKEENKQDNKIISYETWFKRKKLIRSFMLWDDIRYRNHSYALEANFLFNKIKIFCLILVTKEKNVQAAKHTWMKGCNSIKYVYLNATKIKIMPKRDQRATTSWSQLCKALTEIHTEAFDWLLVAMDYTFVITENLRHYVAPLNQDEYYYLGHVVKFWGTMYNVRDAGYVLSRGALSKFKQRFRNECSTYSYQNREDFYLGRYLNKLNISPIDTVDSEGFSLFFPYDWYHIFFPGETYYKTSVYIINCCGQYSVSFKVTESDKMYLYYYLLYKLQLFVDGNLGNRAPYAIPDEEVWGKFLKERNVSSRSISNRQYYELWLNLIDDPMSFAKNMKREMHFDYD